MKMPDPQELLLISFFTSSTLIPHVTSLHFNFETVDNDQCERLINLVDSGCGKNPPTVDLIERILVSNQQTRLWLDSVIFFCTNKTNSRVHTRKHELHERSVFHQRRRGNTRIIRHTDIHLKGVYGSRMYNVKSSFILIFRTSSFTTRYNHFGLYASPTISDVFQLFLSDDLLRVEYCYFMCPACHPTYGRKSLSISTPVINLSKLKQSADKIRSDSVQPLVAIITEERATTKSAVASVSSPMTLVAKACTFLYQKRDSTDTDVSRIRCRAPHILMENIAVKYNWSLCPIPLNILHQNRFFLTYPRIHFQAAAILDLRQWQHYFYPIPSDRICFQFYRDSFQYKFFYCAGKGEENREAF